MDMSVWQCGECGCQSIAYGLELCPQCGAPKAAQAPADAAPKRASKAAAAAQGGA